MNKISKKIVALATMAAFVLTLVPAAAFAADTDASSVEVNSKSAVVEIDQDTGVATADVTLTVAGNDLGDYNYVVWLTDENGDVYRYAKAADADSTSYVTTDSTQWPGAALILNQNPSVATSYEIEFTIAQTGKYTVHAGVDTTKAATTYEDLIQPGNIIPTVTNAGTIEVQDNTVVQSLKLTVDSWSGKGLPLQDGNVFDLNLLNDKFMANGSDEFVLTGTAYLDDAQGKIAANKVITLESEKPDVLKITTKDVDPDTAGVQVKTDKNGQFKLSFKMNDNRNVPITITAGDDEYTVKVVKESTRAYDIDVVEDGGYVLAGKSTKWNDWAALVENNSNWANLNDAVTFSVSDIKGNAVSTEDMANEPALYNYKTGSVTQDVVDDHGRCLSIENKPDDSTLNAYDLVLTEVSDGVYTLQYRGDGTQSDRAKDLIPGKYVVTVSLLSGDYAEATFYVADYGKTQDTELSIKAYDRSAWQNGTGEGSAVREVVVDDEITLGQNVTVNAVTVDENGLKIKANNINIGAQGKALIDNKFSQNGELAFQTVADVAANESLLGTKIYITAFGDKDEQWLEKELLVVDSYNTLGLDFTPEEGPVAEDNDVTVNVVKEDGSTAQVTGTIVGAYVADQSNKDAKVTVDVDNDTVSKGKGEITVYASQPTTAEIVVAVEDSTNHGLYVGNLNYTFGNVDITAHHNVVMTIGSSEYVVDKQLFTMDAAPYVDSNWRTMVPIRALAEAFDATVTYDNDDRTVTIEYNDQTIVMTIDEATYTVNGEEAEMDTEAVIKGDRTYVPVRFAAEAMGFTVTALYDENSSTASVVFQS